MAKYCDGIALDRRGILEAAKAFRLSELRLRFINPDASANELKTTLRSHSIIHGDAYFAYLNKIWGIP